jgi:hypothetical protein
MATFMPGVRISQAHGTTRLADPATGARDATVFAMYHPAYALRNPAVERESFDDVGRIPAVLVEARERRAINAAAARATQSASLAGPTPSTTPSSASQAPADDADQLTIF